MKVIDNNGRTVEMTKREVIEGYLAAEKPYDVCVHTIYGGYLEFVNIQRGIMFKENAIDICNQYAELWHKDPDYKGICVRENCQVIYETECKKEAK